MKNAWGGGLDPSLNMITPGSVEPADGGSVALAATGSDARMASAHGGGSGSSPVAVADASATGQNIGLGSPIMGFAIFAVLVALAMWGAHEIGDDGDFANIRASFFNVWIITLVAAAGIPLLKVAAIKLADMGTPGADHLASWVLAA